MDSQFDPRNLGVLVIGDESYARDGAEPARHMALENPPNAGLSDTAWFHILWFSAAILGMPALIAALVLLF